MQVEGRNDELMGMTDYQFQCYKDERDEKERELRREIQELKTKQIAGETKSPSAHIEGDSLMTELQFTEYQKVCAERDALREANRELQRTTSNCGESGMTDYQFKQYEALRDERDALKKENESLREEIEQLRQEKASDVL